MNTTEWLEYYTTHPKDFDSMIKLAEDTILEQAATIDRANLRIIAKDMQIAELTRMLFALGKQDGQTIRNLTEENRGLRQMLHMEPK